MEHAQQIIGITCRSQGDIDHKVYQLKIFWLLVDKDRFG